jgi:hypothetical protein
VILLIQTSFFILTVCERKTRDQEKILKTIPDNNIREFMLSSKEITKIKVQTVSPKKIVESSVILTDFRAAE